MSVAGEAGAATEENVTGVPGPLGFPDPGPPLFSSVTEVRERLAEVGYLADDGIAGVVHLADRLAKPVLVEGPAGTGKTELAKSVARVTGSRLIRLQCYEGLDESKALYEWNYKKQLLRIQAQRVVDDTGSAPGAGTAPAAAGAWRDLEDDIFSEEFLLTRPLLEAIRSHERVVLLIDEVDRVELETEALLLEVLSEYQVSIPELGTVRAEQIPLVFLTSNNTRELSEALKRRCLYLHLDYPSLERERDIVLARVPGVTEELADQVARIVRSLRTLELKKYPSVSETLDWARTLVVLGVESIDAQQATATLHVLLKYRSDLERAAKELAGAGEKRA
ncbi:MAG TPA: MoxR family ATPase [Acidimicrobiales bacterium]|nr:MoxR family ATPase [Acidimicrobiales bacterium]